MRAFQSFCQFDDLVLKPRSVCEMVLVKVFSFSLILLLICGAFCLYVSQVLFELGNSINVFGSFSLLDIFAFGFKLLPSYSTIGQEVF